VGIYEDFPALDDALEWAQDHGEGKYFVKPLSSVWENASSSTTSSRERIRSRKRKMGLQKAPYGSSLY
jgi:hypothetical protein